MNVVFESDIGAPMYGENGVEFAQPDVGQMVEIGADYYGVEFDEEIGGFKLKKLGKKLKKGVKKAGKSYGKALKKVGKKLEKVGKQVAPIALQALSSYAGGFLGGQAGSIFQGIFGGGSQGTSPGYDDMLPDYPVNRISYPPPAMQEYYASAPAAYGSDGASYDDAGSFSSNRVKSSNSTMMPYAIGLGAVGLFLLMRKR